MASTLVPEPFHRPGWVYEEKYDGWRMLAFKNGARVRLISRQGVDHTARFRELAAAIAQLRAPELVLDGEGASSTRNLVSQFHLLGRPDPAIIATPPVMMAFDCPARARRRRARPDAAPAAGDARGRTGQRPRHLPGPPPGRPWAHRVGDREGARVRRTVGKDQESTYRAGTSRAWLKLKVRYEGAFAIGGIAKDGDHFRGLLLGRRRGRGLPYVGFVEYGFTRGSVAELFDRSRRLVRTTSPFTTAPDRAAVWLEPELLAEISYSELMEGWLRDPVYRGLI